MTTLCVFSSPLYISPSNFINHLEHPPRQIKGHSLVDDSSHKHRLNLDFTSSSSHQISFLRRDEISHMVDERLQSRLGKLMDRRRQPKVFDGGCFQSYKEVFLNFCSHQVRALNRGDTTLGHVGFNP
jgi:hypothetical protein